MCGDQKLFLSLFDFTDFWKLSWATHKTILNETGINVDQTEKKHAVFPAKFSLFFLKKNAGSSTGKFRMKKWEKTRSKKKCIFCARKFWGLPDVQYYCGMLFRYKYWCPESLGYVRPLYTCHGRLFQKVPKILPKNAKKSVLGHTFQGKMLLRVGPTNFFFIGIKFHMQLEYFAAEIMGCSVAMWNFLYEQKLDFHLY